MQIKYLKYFIISEHENIDIKIDKTVMVWTGMMWQTVIPVEFQPMSHQLGFPAG